MPKKSNILLLAVLSIFCFAESCVPKKDLLSAQYQLGRMRRDSTQMDSKINMLEKNVNQLQDNVAKLENARIALENQLEATRKEANNRLQDASSRLQETSTKLNDASSQLNKSQQQIADQQQRLEQLQQLIDQQKQNTEALRSKIANALTGFNSSELTVAKKNGKVYVSLQENLLFPSGSAVVNPKGKEALGKLAGVLNVNADINVNIEGHTDSIPMRGKYEDNWELSTARANAIVRILTETYFVDATRVTASGHSKFDPVDTNLTREGRARNRRTEIILEPKLDELMQLIQSGGSE